MKRTLSLFLTLVLIVLLCVTFCHEAFHNDADGGLCVICSWIFSVRTLLYAAVLALSAGIGLPALREGIFTRTPSCAYRLSDTPVLRHDKLSD